MQVQDGSASVSLISAATYRSHWVSPSLQQGDLEKSRGRICASRMRYRTIQNALLNWVGMESPTHRNQPKWKNVRRSGAFLLHHPTEEPAFLLEDNDKRNHTKA